MSKQSNLFGATLAVAAALAFITVPAVSFADSDYNKPCRGANSCKGQSACKGANNACKGLNACKGQGFVMEESSGDCNGEGGTVLDDHND
jgi:hypothetical protein